MSFTPVTFDELADFLAETTGYPREKIHPSSTLHEDIGIAGEDGDELFEETQKRYQVSLSDYTPALFFGPEIGFSFRHSRLIDYGYIEAAGTKIYLPKPTVQRFLDTLNTDLQFQYHRQHGLPLPTPPPFYIAQLHLHRQPLSHLLTVLLWLPTLVFAVGAFAQGGWGILFGLFFLFLFYTQVAHLSPFWLPRFFTTPHIVQLDASDEGLVFHYATGLSRQRQKTPLIPWTQIALVEAQWLAWFEVPDYGRFYFYENLFHSAHCTLFFSSALKHRIQQPA